MAVMISIQPKWVEEIARGRKLWDIRKGKPKSEVPFKCYIYCTKTKKGLSNTYSVGYMTALIGRGKVIGDFVCDKVDTFESEFWDDDTYESIGEVWYDEDGERNVSIFVDNGDVDYKRNKLCRESCLSWEELRRYIGTGFKTFYAWHISDLKIYDKPKEIGEFRTPPCEKSEKAC